MTRTEYQAAYYRANKARKQSRDATRTDSRSGKQRIIAIDGEGLTIKGKHLYCYLAAWDSENEIIALECLEGLKTVDCLEVLLSLPSNALLVGFSLGYDYTKILTNLPNDTLYLLMHPESRSGRHGPRPIRWGEYKLNLVQGRLTIAKGKKSVSIWDIWQFFQGSFLSACSKWGILSDTETTELEDMKAKRSEFTIAEWFRIKRYCGLECRSLAKLASKLKSAHKEAGLPLQSYFGAGSTGHAMLTAMGAKDFMVPWHKADLPQGLRLAVAMAFFGGRFECSRVGPVKGTIYSADIASAYPYEFARLPCLIHGKWHHIKSKPFGVDLSTTALVRYRLRDSVPITKGIKRPFYPADSQEYRVSPLPWGPFPIRLASGDIVCPVTSGGGWVWKPEYLAAREHWDNIEVLEAWVYNTHCDCRVFRDTMPEYYKTRLQWGKEGKGIVVKLGCNSCPGKCAQSKGHEPAFQNFIWAGLVNSGTRARLLEAITALSPHTVIATATDGILSTHRLELRLPEDTGTSEIAKQYGKGALGEWETKVIEGGVFLIRPGVLFPLKSEIDIDGIKARGVGKKILLDERARIVRQYQRKGPIPFEVKRSTFYGARLCVRLSAGKVVRDDKYGQWSSEPRKISYLTTPKRPYEVDGMLHTWALPQSIVSEPYGPAIGKRAIIPPHVLEILREKDMMIDAPDKDDRKDMKGE